LISRLLYQKKRQQRWWRYLQLRAAYQAAQQASDPASRLCACFRKLGYGKPSSDLKDVWAQWVNFGALLAPKLETSEATALENRIVSLDGRQLPVLAWLDLYRLAIGVGVYGPANALRNKAITRAASVVESTSKGNLSAQEVALGFYCNLELGRFSEADILLRDMGTGGLPAEQVGHARWFLSLYKGDLATSEDGPLDKEFESYLRGQRVAIVGPVKSHACQGTEIDAHDRVVKFSYQGGEKGRDALTQGQRIDVSYYNNTQSQRLAESGYSNVLEQLSWIVCINRKGRSRFPSHERKIRQIYSLQWMLPDTHFNAGPNAFIDILRCQPAGIKVFNTDLMLSAGRYAGYRKPGAKDIDYTRSFIKTHDPILQYVTIHRLWSLGYLEGDARFEEVMGLGLTGYLARLQRVHGAHDQALL